MAAVYWHPLGLRHERIELPRAPVSATRTIRVERPMLGPGLAVSVYTTPPHVYRCERHVSQLRQSPGAFTRMIVESEPQGRPGPGTPPAQCFIPDEIVQ